MLKEGRNLKAIMVPNGSVVVQVMTSEKEMYQLGNYSNNGLSLSHHKGLEKKIFQFYLQRAILFLLE